MWCYSSGFYLFLLAPKSLITKILSMITVFWTRIQQFTSFLNSKINTQKTKISSLMNEIAKKLTLNFFHRKFSVNLINSKTKICNKICEAIIFVLNHCSKGSTRLFVDLPTLEIDARRFLGMGGWGDNRIKRYLPMVSIPFIVIGTHGCISLTTPALAY